MRNRLSSLLLALALLALSPAAASALDRCKARINKKTGQVEVSASNVVGTPRWGGGPPDDPTTPIPNLASCQKGGKLKRCLLGDDGTYSARRTTASCWLVLADDSTDCQAHIRGCSASSVVTAYVAEIGTPGNWGISRGMGAVSVNHTGTGEFEVEFDRAVDECFPSATGQSQGGVTACAHCGATNRHALVRVYDASGVPTDFNAFFYLVMHCP